MNSITLIGRLAKAPEIRQITTQKGETEVARFPLVVRRNRTNKAFVVMITAYGGNAGFVQKYLEKGTKVTICGELVISQIKMRKMEPHLISQKSLWIQWNLLNPNQRENLVVRDLSLQEGQAFLLKYQKRWNRKCHFVKEKKGGLRT